jgi:hypothetical protein
MDQIVRARAGRRDADLHAFQVLERLEAAGPRLRHPERDLRQAALQREGAEILFLALQADGVLVGARDHLGAAPDHRPERLRSAGEVADLDLQAFGLEIAELLGDRERQVVERALSADGDVNVALLDLSIDQGRECEENDGDGLAHESP